jgi:AAA+ superfamily predicted ATPase
MGEPDNIRYPDWAAKLRESYLSGAASQFLLHSNVGDQQPWEEDGKIEYITLIEWLTRFLSRTKEIVTFYNISDGLGFVNREMRDTFIRRISVHRRAKNEPEWNGLIPLTPSAVLGLLGEFISIRSQRAAVVVDYAEMIAPEGDLSYLSSDDRACLVSVQEWSRNPSVLTSDNIVILITENLMEVNRRIRSQPQLMTIEIGLPDREDRLYFIKHILTKYHVSGLPAEMVADMTAGLTCIQIEGIYKNAAESGGKITMEDVGGKRKEVIERECMGLVEVQKPVHGFEAIGAMEPIKKALRGVAEAIRRNEKRRAPMGIMLVGAMGTGKTFLAEAFAKESGLTCIKLKSFREKWVGATEANLERILRIIQALGYVLVIIDEADRNLSSDRASGDSGTESRVIARIKEFMSDTRHRGKIVFMVLTNRPDKLDVDMKRPGRLDLKIPMFYPESADERRQILSAVALKNGLVLEKVDFKKAGETTADYSAADLEGLLVTADRIAAEDSSPAILPKHLDQALTDFIPSRNQLSIEYMELQAAFEASSKRLLPERYRSLDNAQMSERIEILKAKLNF